MLIDGEKCKTIFPSRYYYDRTNRNGHTKPVFVSFRRDVVIFRIKLAVSKICLMMSFPNRASVLDAGDRKCKSSERHDILALDPKEKLRVTQLFVIIIAHVAQIVIQLIDRIIDINIHHVIVTLT